MPRALEHALAGGSRARMSLSRNCTAERTSLCELTVLLYVLNRSTLATWSLHGKQASAWTSLDI